MAALDACLLEADQVAVLLIIAELAVSIGLEEAGLVDLTGMEHQQGVDAFLD